MLELLEVWGDLCGDERDKSGYGSISCPAMKLISELYESKLSPNPNLEDIVNFSRILMVMESKLNEILLQNAFDRSKIKRTD